VAAVKEKALGAKIPRVSHECRSREACSARAAGYPLGWRGASPRKASAKKKSVIMIPRQNGYLNRRGQTQRPRERRQNTVAPRTEE